MAAHVLAHSNGTPAGTGAQAWWGPARQPARPGGMVRPSLGGSLCVATVCVELPPVVNPSNTAPAALLERPAQNLPPHWDGGTQMRGTRHVHGKVVRCEYGYVECLNGLTAASVYR